MGDGSGDASSYIKNQVNVSGTNAQDTRLSLTGVSSQNISGLTIPPNVIAASTSDSDSNGEIDQILVTLSETIIDGSSTLNNTTFTVAGYTVSGTITGSSANDNQVLISLTESGSVDTEKTPNVVLIASKISDGSSALGSNQTFTSTTDGAKPAILSAATGDNNADGTVDRLVLTFSEQVDLSSVDNNNFTLTESASGSSLAISGSYSSSDQTSVTLTLTGVTANNTSLTISPNYNNASGTIKDNSSNEMSFSETVAGIDLAAPALVSASYKDTETPIGNAQVNRIDAVFSETLTSSNYESGDWTFPSNSASLSKSSGTVSGNTVQITVTGAPTNTTVLGTTTIKYTDQGTDNSITDGTNNTATMGSAITVTDGAAPVLLSASYKDSNGDGTVNRIDAVYSENITGSSFFESGDWALPTNSANLTVSSGAFSGSNVQITVGRALANTTALGTTTLKYTSTAVTANSMSDGINPSVNSDVITLTDAALPVIVSAETGDANNDGTVDRLTLTFSEQVDLTNVANANFTLTEIPSGSSAAISGTYSSSNQTSVVLTLTGVTANRTDHTISPKYNDAAGTIIDNALNEMSFSETVTGTDGAAPVLLSADYKDTNANGNVDRIDAKFSEDISSSVFESGDWTFPTNPKSAGVASGVVVGSVVRITVSGVSGSSLGTTTVKYTSNQGTANSVTDGIKPSITSNVITVSADNTAPTVTATNTIDNDADGQIDQILVTFSEAVKDVSSTINNTSFTVAGGYTVSNTTTGSSANDNQLLIILNEKSSADTDETPNVVLRASKIKDASGNVLSSNQTFTETTDGAAPALMSATYKDINGDGTVDRIDALYSEDISSSVFELGDWTLPTNGSGLTVSSAVLSGSTVLVTVGSAPANTTNLSIFHNDKIIQEYISCLDKIFYYIKRCENNDLNINEILNNDVCHTGFKRLN